MWFCLCPEHTDADMLEYLTATSQRRKILTNLGYLSCHGGVTYTESGIYITAMMRTHGGLDLIVLIALTGMMLISAKQYFGDDPEFKKFFHTMEYFWRESFGFETDFKIRSLAYVKDECKKLIDQIEKE